MNTQSLLGKIVTVVAVLVLASLLLSLVLGLIGGLIGLIFRFGIPLLLAVLIVRWLTNVRQRPKNTITNKRLGALSVPSLFDYPKATSKTIIRMKPVITPKLQNAVDY